jgi:hypothetical protein
MVQTDTTYECHEPQSPSRGQNALEGQNGPRRSARSRSKIASLFALLALNINQILGKYPGWRWSVERSVLLCPDGQVANPVHATQHKGRDVLRLRVEANACRVCGQRKECTQSTNPDYCRWLFIRLPETSLVPSAPSSSGPSSVPTSSPPSVSAASPPSVSAASPPSVPPTSRKARSYPAAKRWSPPVPAIPGPHQASAPSLVPAVLRKLAAKQFSACRITIYRSRTEHPASKVRHPSWIAPTPAERQHRRHTYAERLARRHRTRPNIEIAPPRKVTRAEIRRGISFKLLLQPHAAQGKTG